MKIIDCFWELKNLDSRVVEISIDKEDILDVDELLEGINNYDYAVVRVPTNRVDVNIKLAELSFTFIECQYRISKSLQSFDFSNPLVKRIIPKIQFKEIRDRNDLEIILSQMTENMFSSDRITLDQNLGPKYGLRRYSNWLVTEFENNTSKILLAYYKNNPVGFSMYRECCNNVEALLGGLFEKYQALGLGILTPSILFLYSLTGEEHKFDKMITSISSNNMPVIEWYNYLGFNLLNTTYVYVKHIK